MTRSGERVKDAVENKEDLDGMRRSFQTILTRQKENLGRIPDLDARKQRLRKTKEESVGNESLFTLAVATLRENGFRVVLAKTAEAAIEQIKAELHGFDLVVKSKSNVAKELHLTEELERDDMLVVETDLGDRIIQLAGCQAVHPTGPACHMTRHAISELFTKHFKRSVSENPMELTRIMREEIADYMARARVGITGANAVTASEGAVVIVHNEGNAAKCAMLPDKHIIVTTPDKVVPTIDDAVNITKLQTYLSTGKIVSSYINVITGLSYTSDIEKQVYKGMHGPKEVVIVFVDDGRLSAEDKESQYCIGCGMCLLYCPTYNVVGPLFGSSGHMGGQGIYLEGSRGKIEDAIESGLFLCTSCGVCKEVCPSSIDTKKGIISVRNSANNLKKEMSSERESIIASVRNYDNPWQAPRKQKGKWGEDLGLKKKGSVLYFAGCSTSLLFPDTAKRAVRVLRASGVDPAVLGKDEKCCGSTARKLGELRLSRAKAEDCFKDFKDAGAEVVVTTCPGCSSSLNQHKDLLENYGITIQHISQFLDDKLDGKKLRVIADLGPVTFHDPCDLGRELGIYEEPRRLLVRATGVAPVEMERSRTMSACCGSGAGVKSTYPELAKAIGIDRIAMAKAAGARTIVTSCPWCVKNLRDCQGGRPDVDVVDLLDLLDRSLGSASK